jgi:hypothetical protein
LWAIRGRRGSTADEEWIVQRRARTQSPGLSRRFAQALHSSLDAPYESRHARCGSSSTVATRRRRRSVCPRQRKNSTSSINPAACPPIASVLVACRLRKSRAKNGLIHYHVFRAPDGTLGVLSARTRCPRASTKPRPHRANQQLSKRPFSSPAGACSSARSPTELLRAAGAPRPRDSGASRHHGWQERR